MLTQSDGSFSAASPTRDAVVVRLSEEPRGAEFDAGWGNGFRARPFSDERQLFSPRLLVTNPNGTTCGAQRRSTSSTWLAGWGPY